MSQVADQVYDGPLDALLQLIEDEELDITTVSLAAVTDRYLSHVETLERQDLPEISDWLVIAARLILLKSRALLAEPETDDGEPDDLAAQLMEYKRMKELAERLGDELAEAVPLVGGLPQRVTATGELVTDGVSVRALSDAFTKLIDELPVPRPLREESLEPQVTLEQCIDSIRRTLGRGQTAFAALFTDVHSRLTMIVTFLAVLELFKQQQVTVADANGGLTLELRG